WQSRLHNGIPRGVASQFSLLVACLHKSCFSPIPPPEISRCSSKLISTPQRERNASRGATKKLPQRCKCARNIVFLYPMWAPSWMRRGRRECKRPTRCGQRSLRWKIRHTPACAASQKFDGNARVPLEPSSPELQRKSEDSEDSVC